MLLDYAVEYVPDFGTLHFHRLLRTLNGGNVALLLQLIIDKRLE